MFAYGSFMFATGLFVMAGIFQLIDLFNDVNNRCKWHKLFIIATLATITCAASVIMFFI